MSWLIRALALSTSPAIHIAPAWAGVAAGSAENGTAASEGPVPDRAQGYGRDPDLLHPHVTWPLTLTAQYKAAVSRLADVFLPQVGRSPAASAIGVPEFVDEWVSAPYPMQRADRELILAGLEALQSDAPASLHALSPAQAEVLVATLSERAAAGHEPYARFFSRFRNICLVGHYSSMTGVAELGYVGYQPSAEFHGPPPEVLARMGL